MYATPLIDENFDINKCHTYILSIQCSLDGFSFSLFDPDFNKFIYFCKYSLNSNSIFGWKSAFDEIRKEDDILQKKFKNIHFCFLTDQLTAVPSTLFIPDKTEIYFNSTFEPNRNNIILHSVLKNDVVILYSMPIIIFEYFNEKYTNIKFHSPVDALYNHDLHLASQKRNVLVYKANHILYLACIQHSKIEFINTFFVKNDVDCLFYILSSVKNSLDEPNPVIHMYGPIKPKSDLPNMLAKYFEHINFAKFNPHYSVSYRFYKEPEHYNLNTLELALCE